MKQNHIQQNSLFSGILHIHKDWIFFRLRFFIAFMIIYTIAVAILDYSSNFIDVSETYLWEFNLLFSFCLSLIIAFRLNVSASRWWEARTLLGYLVNDTRNLATKINTFIGFGHNNQEIANLIAKLPEMLKFHLRKDWLNINQLSSSLALNIDQVTNVPLYMVQLIIKYCNQQRRANMISLEEFLRLDVHTTQLIDIIGGCEKINHTLMPQVFGRLAKSALIFYMLIFPIGWTDKFGIFMIPIIMVIIYILLGLEVLAEDMETPFIRNPHSLDLEAICDTIEKSVAQINLGNK